MAGQGSRSRKKRRASSDMEDSVDEEDRMEQLLSNHQQRNVSNWGQGDDEPSASNSRGSASRMERRDERRDMQRKKRRDENEMIPDESFHIDTVGTGVRVAGEKVTALPASASTLSVQRVDGLLLPGHVDVQSEENEGATANDEDDIVDEKEDEAAQGELGDFVRLDVDKGGAARYYEVEEEEQRKAFEECPTCGEKGHDKKTCPHLQCLACGVLDEHSTRECPMSVSCFRCGGQGHKSFDCKKPRTQGQQGWKECQRCGSTAHVDSKCSMLWRIYDYNSSAAYNKERCEKYMHREGAARERTGRSNGGFEYRSESDDEEEEGEVFDEERPPFNWDPVVRWCYNCAAKGNHWGDDCPLPRCNPTRQGGDPSGFSEYMASSGPFAHTLPPPPLPDQYAYRMGPGRGYKDYDRFEAGPQASMHVYDPQREAMHNVDQLFDRYGPAANRRRDAIRRGRGDQTSQYSTAPPAPSPRVARRSGEGSKAERYQAMAQDRERDRWSSADYHRRDGRSSQVSASGNGPAIAVKNSSDQTSTAELLDDFEMTHVVLGSSSSKKTNKAGKKEKSPAKMKKVMEKKMLAATRAKRKLGLSEQATKEEVKAAMAVKKEESKIAKQKAKAAKRSNDPTKIAAREQMKVAFQEAQARRLVKGRIEEHDRKAKEFASQEEKWMTGS